MDRIETINQVAAELHASEQAIDAAIVQATTLVQAFVGARAKLSLSPVAAAGSQTKAMEAVAALGAAREAMIACHAEMAKDHRRLGFGVYNVGPLDKPDDAEYGPPKKPTVEAAAAKHLKVV
ncbi:hypothetical protein ACO2Q1_07770 [Brevundimonas sp. VNH65]|uniref:hypothetical protein n=1 Tax=Brevundimonas sp. VNH65 TaxID=3400917 RepID=UPI003C0E2F2A